MKHIKDLTLHEVEQEIGIFSQQLDLAHALGMKKKMQEIKQYLDALWARLEEIAPSPEIDEDELMVELGLC
jgi:hypothetical protein